MIYEITRLVVFLLDLDTTKLGWFLLLMALVDIMIDVWTSECLLLFSWLSLLRHTLILIGLSARCINLLIVTSIFCHDIVRLSSNNCLTVYSSVLHRCSYNILYVCIIGLIHRIGLQQCQCLMPWTVSLRVQNGLSIHH